MIQPKIFATKRSNIKKNVQTYHHTAGFHAELTPVSIYQCSLQLL